MKLAQYEVEVNCTKKKEGRQLAAQKILKLMHSHIETWGSMLRLYGSRMAESFLKMENQNDTNKEGDEASDAKQTGGSSSQSEHVEAKKSSAPSANAATSNEKITNQKAKPNKELLEKLKEEMLKLRKTTASSETAAVATTPEANAANKENSFSMGSETLLTIKPLLLGNAEFKLSSSDFLMSTSTKKGEDAAEQTQVDDGKIMFADSLLERSNINEDEGKMGPKKKKRKLTSYSDEENISRSSSESDEDDEDDDESDESADGNDSHSD